MGRGLIVLIVVVLVLLMFGGMYVSSKNQMVAKNETIKSNFAEVDNNMKRRADLIPNLVSTVSGAANFEKSTLTEITEARASVGHVKINPNAAPTDPAKLAEFDRAQSQLGSALSRLLVVVERYPDLKATANFRDLQAQLEGTENRISVERRDFNQAVQSYNTAIKSFPAVFYAGVLGFSVRPYFNATPGAETPPKVQFDFGKPATNER